MSYDRHDDAVRTGIRRVAVTSVDDTNATTDASGQTITQQLVDAQGYDGDSPSKMVRVQSHGFHSNPPEGSEGLALSLGGRSDRLHVIGLDHQDYRPKNVPSGDVAVYNNKSVLLQTAGDDLNHNQNGIYTMTVKSLVVKCGGVTVTIDSNGLAITGGSVTHDGHKIDKTHLHVDAGGSGLSGQPQ